MPGIPINDIIRFFTKMNRATLSLAYCLLVYAQLNDVVGFNGPYHHGVEAFYGEPATSVYSKHRECHGKPNNEDITCSFSEIKRSFERHKNYFSIPVGTFWKEKCVDSSRGEPELPSNTPPSNFQFMKDRCLKYEYKNGSYLEAPDRSKSSTMSIHKQSAFSFLLIYICGALK